MEHSCPNLSHCMDEEHEVGDVEDWKQNLDGRLQNAFSHHPAHQFHFMCSWLLLHLLMPLTELIRSLPRPIILADDILKI